MPDGDLAQASAELDLRGVVQTVLTAHEQHLVRHECPEASARCAPR
ncbi:hypothetical protein PGH47_41140 [Streptomyces sp. HUAS 31]|nr:hypothetical protein [Streptomyces sp. HUAS 31]WCE02374.1 hypothetical protein PGH47_41140 [Streptomyces sp. HUAS 31]